MNESHYTEKICKVNANSENARCFICVYGMHNRCFPELQIYGIIKFNIFFTDKMKQKDRKHENKRLWEIFLGKSCLFAGNISFSGRSKRL